MKHHRVIFAPVAWLGLVTPIALAPPAPGREPAGGSFTVKLLAERSVEVVSAGGSRAVFAPRLGVHVGSRNPRPKLRWLDFGQQRRETINYNVLAWTVAEADKRPAANAAAQVEDGCDPASDQAMSAGAVADVFKAVPLQIGTQDESGTRSESEQILLSR